MALDPTIPLRAGRIPGRSDPMRNTLGALKIAQTQQSMAAQQRKMELEQRQRQKLAQISAMPEADQPGAVSAMQLAGGDIKGWRSGRKAELEERLKTSEIQRDQTDMALRGLTFVRDQASYNDWVGSLSEVNPELASQLPPEYTQQLKGKLMEHGLSVKDRLRRQLEMDKFEHTKMHQKEMRELKRQGKDQSIVNVGGPTVVMPGAQGLDKKNARDAQKNIIGGMKTVTMLEAVSRSYDPEFLTFYGQGKQMLTRLKEKAGAKLSPEERDSLGKYSRFRQNVEQHFNQYRKEITGAAAAVQELDRLKKSMFNTDNSPTEFESMFNEYQGQSKRGVRIYQHVLRRGVPIGSPEFERQFAALWNSGADDDAQMRGEELKAANFSDAQVVEQLKREGYTAR